MNTQLKQKLQDLAAENEIKSFSDTDPCQFLTRYTETVDVELAGFTAANLAFGRREQIISHLNKIFNDCDRLEKTVSRWTIDGDYKDFFDGGNTSFYRMFTHDSMKLFFERCRQIILQKGTLGEFFKEEWQKNRGEHLFKIICRQFPEKCNLIPHSDSSSCKRVNMFLRWMVRDNSPVDLGLWTWYDKSRLLMPMDTHVLQQACKLGLLGYTSSGKVPGATLKNCIELTEKLKEVFGDDPVKGDFALFGAGVNG